MSALHVWLICLLYMSARYVFLICLPYRSQVSRLSEARVRQLVTQISRGIQHIHSRRMLHRDIKPHNILLTPDGRCVR